MEITGLQVAVPVNDAEINGTPKNDEPRESDTRTEKGEWFVHAVVKRPNEPKLSHAGTNDVNRESELTAPSRVGSSDLLGRSMFSCDSLRTIVTAQSLPQHINRRFRGCANAPTRHTPFSKNNLQTITHKPY